MKFQMVHTTHAFVTATKRSDEPIVAKNFPKVRNLYVVAPHAANSNPARRVSNNHDHPVKEIGNAPILPSDSFA